MPIVRVREAFAGSWRDVFEQVGDFENYPGLVPDLTSVKVVDRGPDWTVSRWEARVGGTRMAWTERDRWLTSDGSGQILFEQVEGDLKRFSGYWQVSAQGEGAVAEFLCEFEIGPSGLAVMLHPVAQVKLRQSMAGLLRNLKDRMEVAADGAPIRFLDSSF
ncbi:MAG: SRPBCC family protein [Kyrpidia sp.]|nr:SRPBCC family protein [Kyrpidia sp.]